MREAVARARFVRVSPLKARLVINEIRGKPVAEARRLKRLNPRAFGRADIIQRRLSHITVVVAEKEG